MKKKFVITMLIGCMAAGMMTGCASIKNAGVLQADAAATLKLAKDSKAENAEDASAQTTEKEDSGEQALDKKEDKKDEKQDTGEAAEQEAAEEKESVQIDADEATLTVTGSGIATVTPDKASITIGVQTADSSSKTAQDKNSKDVNNVIGALLDYGVKEKDISTSSFDLYANYDYSKDVSELTGYTATTMLTVKNLDVKDVGELLEKAGEAGVNQVNGISFDYTETEAAYDKALDAAMDRAQEKAEKLAAREGCRLGKILSVSEGDSNGSAAYTGAREYKESAAADGGMNVMPGESDVTATVTITYQLAGN